MAKVKVYSIDRREKRRILDELFEVITDLKTKTEVVDFLIGLLTESETIMVGRRIQIAKMLIGDFGYEDIRKRLKVSHLTISKVEHWLKNDDNKHRLISEKIRKITKNRKAGYKSGSLLNKYAHHRFIKELL